MPRRKDSQQTNAPSARLIGREAELSRCLKEIRARGSVVTLVGPSGVGKTALGEAVVARLRKLGRLVVEPKRGAKFTRLAQAASKADSVLWLDACDDVHAAKTVARLGMTSLVASRRRLGLAQEVVVQILPFLVHEEVGKRDAVTLLEAECRRLGTPTSEDERPCLGTIVEYLGGLPAALVLAAHALRTRSAKSLAQELLNHGGDLELRSAIDVEIRYRSTARLARDCLQVLPMQLRRGLTALSYLPQPFSRTLASSVLGEELSRELLETLLDWGLCRVERVAGDPHFEIFGLYARHARRGPARVDQLDRTVDALVALMGSGSFPEEVVGPLFEFASHRSLAAPGAEETKLKLCAALATCLYRQGRLQEASEVLPARSVLAKMPQSSRAAVSCLETRAVLERKARRFDEARVAAMEAVRRCVVLDDRRTTFAMGALGAIELESGQWAEAESSFREVMRMASDLGEERSVALAIGFLGHLRQETGNASEAVVLYRDAAQRLAKLSDQRLTAVYDGYRAMAHEELGQTAEALVLYQEASDSLRLRGYLDYAALFSACHWALATELGQQVREPSLEALEDPAQQAALRIHRLRVEIASGHQLLATELHAARFRMLSDDVRFALRRLSRLRAARAPRDHVCLSMSGGIYSTANQEPMDLRARPTLRRMVDRIIATQLEVPGSYVPAKELAHAAWGEERMLEKSRAHRLRVALSDLRKLGFAALLRRSPEGIGLVENVILVWDTK